MELRWLNCDKHRVFLYHAHVTHANIKTAFHMPNKLWLTFTITLNLLLCDMSCQMLHVQSVYVCDLRNRHSCISYTNNKLHRRVALQQGSSTF